MRAAREAFCRRYIENDGNATEAYDHAFPSTRGRQPAATRVSACRLLKEEAIQERIAELREKADEIYAEIRQDGEEEFVCTITQIARQLDEDRLFARQCGAAAAAVSASVSKGKLFGHFVDKKDITLSMRPDEARQVVAALLGKFADKVLK